MKKEEVKLMRGLDEKHLEGFKKSDWFSFYKEHQEELFLGIRNNYINLYYKGMNIAKIQGSFNNASISARYIYKDFNEESNYQSITYDDFKQKYEKVIKPEVEKHIKKNKLWEKETQQALILKNNKNCRNNKSNWLCIDMEYTKQRENSKSNEEKSFGRFDIIAVNKNNYKVALIELKVGKNAIGGKSGLLKHAKDWQDFVDKQLFFKDINEGHNCLKQEIINIINNKCILESNYPIGYCSEETFKNIEPSFYFIICSGTMTIGEIKNEVRKYLWSEDKCMRYNIKRVSNTYNVENDIDIGYDISKKGAGKLYCEFLFTEGLRDNIKINDIIDDENYDRNIE